MVDHVQLSRKKLQGTSKNKQKQTKNKQTHKQKTQFDEREQASEPDMAEMLVLSDEEFKTATINMLRTLRALINNINNM